MKISYYQNTADTKGEVVSLHSFLKSDKHREKVEQLRATSDKGKRDELKKKMPCGTISGVFGKRAKEGLIQHSGFICIDIDEKDNSHLDWFGDFKEYIKWNKYVAYCGQSVGGKGYFCVIPLKYPEKHLLHYYAIEQDFLKLGITIDKSCKDVSRLRFVSWDDKPFWNFDKGVQYCKTFDEKRDVGRDVGSCTDDDVFKMVYDTILSRRMDITYNYHDWIKIGFDIAARFGENGRSIFHTISSVCSKYNTRECDKQYTHCLRHTKSTNLASLYALFNQAGGDMKEIYKSVRQANR